MNLRRIHRKCSATRLNFNGFAKRASLFRFSRIRLFCNLSKPVKEMSLISFKDTLCVDSIRVLCGDIVQKANSGHPGAPLGLAAVAHVLWTKHLRFNPKNPSWPNRDRFVLSNGHASALLYTLLHLSGVPEWTMDVLKSFRQLHSIAAGHPERGHPGIEVTTGPLGQGISNSVGLAIGEAHMRQKFNKHNFPIFDHFTFVFCSDGDLEEGVSGEACSLAGHLQLGKLIVFYDKNDISIDGKTEMTFTEDVGARFQSYGWHVITVVDASTNMTAIDKAIEEAKKVIDKPSLIIAETVIGFGSVRQGTEEVHGSPLGEENLKLLKLGFDPSQSFVIPSEVKELYGSLSEKGRKLESDWELMFKNYGNSFPELEKEIKRRISKTLPETWNSKFPPFDLSPTEHAATRTLSGMCLNHVAQILPEIIGGSADLASSCKTYIKDSKDIQPNHYDNRNIRFGVREHAMAAISNGIAAYGTFIPFCSTFMNFIGYCFGAVILSALSKLRVIYIFTHDSIFLGEDGPTHQAIEKYALCRATPNLNFFRPADGNETSAAFISAINEKETPTVMSLTRHEIPMVKGTSIEGALKGAYIVADWDNSRDPLDKVILVGTGSELHLCTKAKDILKHVNVRVVSFPCWELFSRTPKSYQFSIFPSNVPVLSVEAAATFGWEKFSHASIGIDRFGYSAPVKDLVKEFNMTPEHVASKAEELINFYKTGRPIPHLVDRPWESSK